MPNLHCKFLRSSLILLQLIWMTPALGSPAGIEALNQARALMQKNKWSETEKHLQKSLESKPNKFLELFYFQLGLAQLKQEKLEPAQMNFQKAFDSAENLKEYSSFYLAKIAEKKNDSVEAEKYYRLIDQMSPNLSLKLEAQKNLSALLMAKNDYKSVYHILAPLEKRSRGSESYPEMIFLLARAENGLKNRPAACKLLRKLYSRYPSSDLIKSWTSELETNEFEGAPTGCVHTLSDFKDRVKSLLWLGKDQQALSEIQWVRKKNKDQEPYSADAILAQYYLQEGEAQKSFDILSNHFKTMKTNFDFLLMYATAAARTGDNSTAVGSYYQAYKLSPRSVQGRRALYQSAFLSYQVLDYDGAYRKFQEFTQKYSRSGLTQDAQWHLAWLKYLKKDYAGAYKGFAQIHSLGRLGRSSRGIQSDRTRYWMAMSLLRQSKYEDARALFEQFGQDKIIGYYSMAAEARLKEVQKQLSDKKPKVAAQEISRRMSHFGKNEFMMPSDEFSFSSITESEESEENIRLSSLSTEKMVVDKNEATNPDKEDSEEGLAAGISDLVEKTTDKQAEKQSVENTSILMSENPATTGDLEGARVSDIKDPILAQRFQKARDLQILGLDDWAKWDLYEIEKRTRNKDYLKKLMTEYSNLKNFHRSSFIAQTYFSSTREPIGTDGVKLLWQQSYPQAYTDEVMEQSKKFDVPASLVWGIMRAESHYRFDAISPVGALGLMQIMPNTGHKMAEKIGLKNFSASSLLAPRIAIEVGTGYLQRLMRNFNRSTPLVAAAYNAGPHRVYSWLNAFGQLQMDEFIEHIPFLETRNYVKKVVVNQQTYSQIYGLNQNLKSLLSDAIQVTLPKRIPAKESWEDI